MSSSPEPFRQPDNPDLPIDTAMLQRRARHEHLALGLLLQEYGKLRALPGYRWLARADRLLRRLLRRAPRPDYLETPIVHFMNQPFDQSTLFGAVEVYGWAFSRIGAIVRVEAFLDNRLLGQVPFGIEKPDVAPYLGIEPPADLAYSGRFAIPDELATRGAHTVRVTVTDSRGTTHSEQRTLLAPRAAYEHWAARQPPFGPHGAPESGNLPSIDILAVEAAGGMPASGAARHGQAQSTAEFILVVQAGFELFPHAMAALSDALRAHPQADVLYGDEDDQPASNDMPFFKPAWSPEYARGVRIVAGALLVRRALLERLPAWTSLYDLLLRASEHSAQIVHVPVLLARATARAALATNEQLRAVTEHLARTGSSATACAQAGTAYLQIVPPARASNPLVSIVIPTRDAPDVLRRCLSTIFEHTRYPNFEVVLVDNETTNPAALAVMGSYPIVRVPFPEAFNYSRANNLGVQHARGEYLVCLNNDTEVVSPHWLHELLYYAEQPDVGAAGALLLYPNRTVQHAGVVVGMTGAADHVMRGFSEHASGYRGSLCVAREVSAVTAACLMLRRSLYEQVQGFDERYASHLQDVDLCLKLLHLGKRNIFAPRAQLIHHESLTRSTYYDMGDHELFVRRWNAYLQAGDPYLHPAFDRRVLTYSLAT